MITILEKLTKKLKHRSTKKGYRRASVIPINPEKADRLLSYIENRNIDVLAFDEHGSLHHHISDSVKVSIDNQIKYLYFPKRLLSPKIEITIDKGTIDIMQLTDHIIPLVPYLSLFFIDIGEGGVIALFMIIHVLYYKIWKFVCHNRMFYFKRKLEKQTFSDFSTLYQIGSNIENALKMFFRKSSQDLSNDFNHAKKIANISMELCVLINIPKRHRLSIYLAALLHNHKITSGLNIDEFLCRFFMEDNTEIVKEII